MGMMAGGVLSVCGYEQDGTPETGEYLIRADGTGVCCFEDADGRVAETVVRLLDGSTPSSITHLNVWSVPVDIHTADDNETRSGLVEDIRDNANQVRLIVEEARLGVLDEREARAALLRQIIHRRH